MLSYSRISNKLGIILLVKNSIEWKLEAFNFRNCALCVSYFEYSVFQSCGGRAKVTKVFISQSLTSQHSSALLSATLQRILEMPHEMSVGGS